MRKSVLIFVMTSLLLSHCITANAQQPNSPVDIAASAKTVADSVAQITLPVSLPEGETIESFLLKHDVYKDEEGNYISQFLNEKKKMTTKDVTFWLMYWAVNRRTSQIPDSLWLEQYHKFNHTPLRDRLLPIPIETKEDMELLRKSWPLLDFDTTW